MKHNYALYTIAGLQVLFVWSLVLLVVLLGACAAPGPRVDSFPAPTPEVEATPARRTLNPLVGSFVLGIAAAGVAVLWPKKRQDA